MGREGWGPCPDLLSLQRLVPPPWPGAILPPMASDLSFPPDAPEPELPDSIFDEEEVPELISAPLAAEPWTHRAVGFLVLITLLAGFLRLYKLGEWSLWIDEAHTLRDAVLMPLDQFFATSRSRYPIGFLLLRFLEPLLPSSGEGSQRLVFAFFGIVSVPLLGIVVRSLLGIGPALIASAILCISPWHIYWSQNCRAYSLVLFFSLCAIGLFHLGVEQGRKRHFFASLFFGGLAGLTHPSAFLLVPGLLVYLACLKWRCLPKPPCLSGKAMLSFVLPVGISFVIGVVIAFDAFGDFFRAKEGESFFHLLNTTLHFVRIPGIVAAFGGAYLVWKRQIRGGVLLAALVLVPFLELAFASFFVKATAQYLFFTLPAWAALGGYGAWEITRFLNVRGAGRIFIRFLPLAMILLDLGAQSHLYFHYRYGDRPRWREAADYIETHSLETDRIVSTNQPSMEWYLNPSEPQIGITSAGWSQGYRRVDLLASWTVTDLKKWKAEAEKKGTRIFVALTSPVLLEADPKKVWDTWIRSHFHQIRRLPNWVGPKDMTILIYRYDPPKKKAGRGLGSGNERKG
ncbi:MAG TPA: glycosyltransferase family 39 protein [Planctomycetes bacterium]|nr:glycosyltransferase family 39 protein [Planctomycetota bacterium]